MPSDRAASICPRSTDSIPARAISATYAPSNTESPTTAAQKGLTGKNAPSPK